MEIKKISNKKNDLEYHLNLLREVLGFFGATFLEVALTAPVAMFNDEDIIELLRGMMDRKEQRRDFRQEGNADAKYGNDVAREAKGD